MARAVWQNLVAVLPAPQRAALEAIKIVVHESDIAFVEYEAAIPVDPAAPITAAPGMFAVSVRDRAMCAHSFTGELFGPAQNLHGITFIIDAVFYGSGLVPEATYLIDICLAEELLKQVVSKYHNQNLDDVSDFSATIWPPLSQL